MNLNQVSEFINSLVRPGITFMLAATFCVIAWRSQITISGESVLSIMGMVFGFWFAARQTGDIIKNIAAANAAASNEGNSHE